MYSKLIEFLGQFFATMNNMGAEIFEYSWVKAIVLFFRYFGWALFATGFLVSVFDVAVEVQSGRADIKGAALNIIKGFFAVSLFSELPIRLYSFCISLQGSLSSSLTNLFESVNVDWDSINSIGGLAAASMTPEALLSPTIFNGFLLIAMGYCVIKVFFANIKRGGILLIQVAVGSLYMFSVPRGYTDGFFSWCKQVVALCLTAFLQSTILVAGLLTWNANFLLGLGLMLAAKEVERIAGHFGLDTSIKGNFTSAIYATTSAVNLTRSIVKK